jgi:predicted glycoside hydrolase/deacetylase ChbG (UPF0249 family)
MQKTIVFTADDLGLDESANLAIERAHRHGALTAASLMMGQPGSVHALDIIRRNPELQIGWHFHACDSQPLTCRRWPWGNSPALAGMALAVSPAARALIRRELLTQWNQFTATGVACRFINGHHHLHIHPFIAREMRQVVSASFIGWVRGFEVNFFAAAPRGSMAHRLLRRCSANWLKAWPADQRTDSLWGLDRTFCMNASEVVQVLPTLPDGHHEFLFHPRRDNDADQRALLELKQLHACSEQ